MKTKCPIFPVTRQNSIGQINSLRSYSSLWKSASVRRLCSKYALASVPRSCRMKLFMARTKEDETSRNEFQTRKHYALNGYMQMNGTGIDQTFPVVTTGKMFYCYRTHAAMAMEFRCCFRRTFFDENRVTMNG